MRNYRPRSLTVALLLLVLPPAAQALTPVGAPIVIADEGRCSFTAALEVIATPKGAFEVIWVDDFDGQAVNGRRFGRDLQPSGPPVVLLPLHGGLSFVDLPGTWALGRYEVAMNVLDFGEDPSDPEAAHRVSLDLEGNPLAPVSRFETQRFQEIAPAAGGDSLQFRFEPPYYGPPTCQSRGILASRIDSSGAPLSAESRVNRRASGWSGGYLQVDRLPNDTFVAAYSTCDRFFGVVARRLNANGAPVGKPIDLRFPGRVGNFGGGNLVLAAQGADLAVAVMVSNPAPGVFGGAYTRALRNGRVFGPAHIPAPAGLFGVAGVVDLEASPAGGGYLLLFQGASSERLTLFAQALDAQGVPQGAPLAVTEEDERGVYGAIAPLPDGRWLVVTRAQSSDNPEICTERLLGTVLAP